MPDYIVAKIDCGKIVLIDGAPCGLPNQPLPVEEGVHVVAMDCACGCTPASATVTGGSLAAPTVVAFTCGKAAV